MNFHLAAIMAQFLHFLNDKKMKKMFFLAFLCTPSILFCQSATINQLVKSKVEIFTEQSGTLIEKTVEEIGTLRSAFFIKVVKLKNLTTGVKINGLLFELGKYKNIIDADEVDGLVKSLALMKDAAATTKSDYTELTYKSRTGIEIKGIFDVEKRGLNSTEVKKWTYSIEFPHAERETFPIREQSVAYLNPADFMAFCGYIESARNKL